MQLHDLKPFKEERKSRKRVGRGGGSGLGGTSGKGHKGQNARSGGGVRPGFEGGQMPLQRRLPKHGFKNFSFKTVYSIVNIEALQKCFQEGQSISIVDIYEHGLAPYGNPVKILSRGDLNTSYCVEAHKFSKAAIDKITNAGGQVKQLEINSH